MAVDIESYYSGVYIPDGLENENFWVIVEEASDDIREYTARVYALEGVLADHVFMSEDENHLHTIIHNQDWSIADIYEKYVEMLDEEIEKQVNATNQVLVKSPLPTDLFRVIRGYL